jgi:hypothetical protein
MEKATKSGSEIKIAGIKNMLKMMNLLRRISSHSFLKT